MSEFLFRPTIVADQAALLGLDWASPLESWTDDTTLGRGEHRHVVRFMRVGDGFVACKELPDELVLREYRLLSALRDRHQPVVTLVGCATGRRDPAGAPLEGVLITRVLGFGIPYRRLFTGSSSFAMRGRLVDALALLLTRLHLAGFYWGDCSLNNALFRRDADLLRAYVVDTETGELHDRLSDGQRRLDLDIAVENVAGGLCDLQAGGQLDAGVDPFATAAELDRRYGELWAALTHIDDVAADEFWRVEARLRDLNRLGFDAREVQVVTGSDGRLRVRPVDIDEGHHHRRLLHLVGIEAHEGQARRILADIETYTAWLGRGGARRVPEAVGAYRWLTERWEPVISRTGRAGEIEDAQFFHEVLDHCWFLSERAGVDVGIEFAAEDYLTNELAREFTSSP